MSELRGKVGNWAASGIVGNVAWLALVAVFGFLSGSFADVAAFAVSHPLAALAWSLLFLFAGIVIGMAIRGRKDFKAAASSGSAAKAASSSLDADSSPTAQSPSSLEDLTNDEQEFVWRVYRKSALRVDPREESIAKALGIKGVVYRTEYPDDRFSVVALCDVMLTGKWVKIMKALDEGEAE